VATWGSENTSDIKLVKPMLEYAAELETFQRAFNDLREKIYGASALNRFPVLEWIELRQNMESREYAANLGQKEHLSSLDISVILFNLANAKKGMQRVCSRSALKSTGIWSRPHFDLLRKR
jgi:hypothetical protein